MHPWAKGTQFFYLIFFFKTNNEHLILERENIFIYRIQRFFVQMRILNGTVSQVSDVAY